MQEKKSRRRKMGGSHGPNSNGADMAGQNGNSQSSKRSSRLDKKMQGNLRTALFYLFALTTTWFLFCFMTFLYFTSSQPFDDHQHKFNAAAKSVENSDGIQKIELRGDRKAGEKKEGQSITDAMQKPADPAKAKEAPQKRKMDKAVSAPSKRRNLENSAKRPQKSEAPFHGQESGRSPDQIPKTDDQSNRLSKIDTPANLLLKISDPPNRFSKIDNGPDQPPSRVNVLALDHPQPKVDSETDRQKEVPQSRSAPCWGLCPQSADDPPNQLDHVVLRVQKYLRTKKHQPGLAPPKQENQPKIQVPTPPKFADLESLQINKVSLPAGGYQPKLIFHIANGSRLVFKPETHPNDSSTHLSPKKDSCRIAGLYSSELAAYYFSLLAPIVQVPQAVGVTLDVTQRVWPIRDKFFIGHSWIIPEDETRCFRGNCRYCRRPICVKPHHKLKGALSLWTPPASLSKLDNPWSELCDRRGTEKWRRHADFCQNSNLTSEFPFFATSDDPRIGLTRLIDTAIFDYLIDNPDRHALYYAPSPSRTKGFILFENSKGFVKADHGDMAILAPLFQCCQIDKATWHILNRLDASTRIERIIASDVVESEFGYNFHKLMANDRLYPFLDDEHLKAIERRLQKVIAVIDLCIEKYGSELVLKSSHSEQ